MNLGETTTSPFIGFFMLGHRASTKMPFCPRTPEISEIGTLATLGAHTFLCRLLIEVRSKAKL